MADPRVIDPARPHDELFHYLPGDVPTPVPAGAVVDWLQGLVQLNQQLADRFRRQKIGFDFDGTAAGQLDSSGNGIIPIYQVGAGFYATFTRIAIEAATYDATNPRTPAAPFSGGWAFLSATPNRGDVDRGRPVRRWQRWRRRRLRLRAVPAGRQVAGARRPLRACLAAGDRALSRLLLGPGVVKIPRRLKLIAAGAGLVYALLFIGIGFAIGWAVT
jgi:hypothetical protein